MPGIWRIASSVVIIFMIINVLTHFTIYLANRESLFSVCTCLPRMIPLSPRLQIIIYTRAVSKLIFPIFLLGSRRTGQFPPRPTSQTTRPQLHSLASLQTSHQILDCPSRSMPSHPQISLQKYLLPFSLTHTPCSLDTQFKVLKNRPKQQWPNLSGRLSLDYVKI